MRLTYIPLFATFFTLSIIPLITNVGQNLEYEYSLLFSWVAVIVLPLCFIFLPKSFYQLAYNKFSSSKHINWLIAACILICAAISFLPGKILLWSGVCKCTSSEHWLWFGVNAIPAIALSLLLCFLIVLLREKIPRIKICMLAFFLYLLSFLDLAYWLWFFPQKRITHLVFGFLHGPIYDRYLPIDMGIILARVSHVCLILGLFYALTALLFNKKKALPLTFLISYLFFGFLSTRYHSVGHGQSRLKDVLPETYKDELFTLHYKKGKNGNQLKAAKNLILESRFHIMELKKQLNLSSTSRIHIYAYPSSLTKKLAFGGGGTDVTDVYTPSIHIQMTSQLYPTLRHELVHALGSDFGFYGLGFHPNMALTEGLAVALAPELRTLDLHQGAHEILRSKKINSIDILFSPFFWKVSGIRSYTVSGSLVSYLLEHRGSEGLKKLYAGRSFVQSFGAGSQEIFSEWQRFIGEKSKDAQNKILAEAIYRSPGALYEKCTHSKPILWKNKLRGGLLTQLRQPRGWDAGRDYNAWLLSLDSNAKSPRSRQLFQEAKKISKKLYKEDPPSPDTLVLLQALDNKLDSEISLPFKHLEDAELQILRSDLWFKFDHKKSHELLNILAKQLEKQNFGERISRQVLARNMLNQWVEGSQNAQWRQYLSAWGPLPKRGALYLESLSEPWIQQYLRLRNGSDQEWQQLETLKKAFNSPTPKDVPHIFKEQWFAKLAASLMQKKEYQLAEQAWAKCSDFAVSGKKLRYLELQRMANFYGQNSLKISL